MRLRIKRNFWLRNGLSKMSTSSPQLLFQWKFRLKLKLDSTYYSAVFSFFFFRIFGYLWMFFSNLHSSKILENLLFFGCLGFSGVFWRMRIAIRWFWFVQITRHQSEPPIRGRCSARKGLKENTASQANGIEHLESKQKIQPQKNSCKQSTQSQLAVGTPVPWTLKWQKSGYQIMKRPKLADFSWLKSTIAFHIGTAPS